MKAGVVETYATTIATTLMAVSSLNKQDWRPAPMPLASSVTQTNKVHLFTSMLQ
jgi:hypothetical protein